MPRSGWIATGSATDAVATASRAGEANKQHVLYALHASFSEVPAAAKLLAVRYGHTGVLSIAVDNGGSGYTTPPTPAPTRGGGAGAGSAPLPPPPSASK